MTTPIVFLDTETTSLRPDRRAWEIGMIRRDSQGEVETRFFVEIAALDLPNAEPAALGVGGFWERHPGALALRDGLLTAATPCIDVDDPIGCPDDGWSVRDGLALSGREAAHVVAAWTHGAVLVGSNVAFDAETLAVLLRENWLAPSWHYHPLDTSSIMLGALADRGERPGPTVKSDDLSRMLGVDPPAPDERHTALGDARWCARIYDATLGATS